MLFRRLFSPVPLAGVCAVCAVTPLALVSMPGPPPEPPSPPRQTSSAPPADKSLSKSGGPVTVEGAMVPQRDWFDWPFLEKLLGGTLGTPPPPRLERREKPPPRKAAPPPASYRTVCVRLCDGFFWPISYSVPQSRAKHDAQKCEKSCPGKARLFLYRNPGEEIDDMVDLQGRRYRDFPKAFLYRTEYVADCTCRGHPWEEEAMARHRSYVEAAKARTAAAPK
jgi:hypothetical protein